MNNAMGRIKPESDYEEIRNARISDNQARLISLGLQKTISELRALTSSPKRKYCKVDYRSNPLRRSTRLRGISPPSQGKVDYVEGNDTCGDGETEETANGHKIEAKSDLIQRHVPLEALEFDYEEIRKACISQNQARLASLGLQRTISELRALTSSPKSDTNHIRKCRKVDYKSTPLRRSSRLSGEPVPSLGKVDYFEGNDKCGDVESEETVNGHKVEAKDDLIQRQIPLEALEFDYEEIRKARISENQARLASLGLQKTIYELRALTSSPKSDTNHIKKCCKVDYKSTPLCRSSRLSGEPVPSLEKVDYFEGNENCGDVESEETVNAHKIEAKGDLIQRQIPLEALELDYEEIRKARISQNQARLASLGLQKTISELRALTSSPKSNTNHIRKCRKVDYKSTPLRRSSRLRGEPVPSVGEPDYFEGIDDSGDDKQNRTVNGHIMRAKRGLLQGQISLEALARRCENKSRGSLYNPVYGICCHFCRQKKLCGEEDCKRCGHLDLDQPCIGKTECSNCHSTNGVLCRACLKVRYGEEMEKVRSSKEWICPHCVEDRGIKRYWICNSSFCLKKRKMVPTGIAIFGARDMGFKSVAHLLMDKLERAAKTRL